MLTQALAEWLAGLQPADVPPRVKQTLRLLSLDTFGCALSGAAQPWARAIRAWALQGAAAPGSARIWGDAGPRLRASDAALVNGAASHAFEVDDFHNAKVHLGAVVLPAALAVAEAIGAPSDRIETAIAAGYEVAIRTSLALQPARARLRGWHLTAVCGPLGAAAAAAVLLRLGARRTAWALGLAGTQAGGLYAFTADGSDSKRLHPGRAAQSGVVAAELAALGLTGPALIYEAEDGGLLSTFTDQADPDRLLERLGDHWHAPDTNFKPYGCCGSAHAHVDAALSLRPKWQAGRRVRAGMAPVVQRQCGYLYQPGSALTAQMSLRYAVATALRHGAVLPAQYEPQCLKDAATVALANAIELVHDPRHDTWYPAQFCGWVEVEDARGGFERAEVMNPSGSSANPDRAAAIHRKFEALVGGLLEHGQIDRVREAFTRFDSTPLAVLLDAATVGRA